MVVNPFENKTSASNLVLVFENKTAVMPEQPTNLRAEIDRLRGKANELEAKLQSDLDKIWAFFGNGSQDAYYSKKMISYSFLKYVDSIRFEKQSFGNKERNFALGRAFEDMLTDCLDLRKYPDITTEDQKQVASWVETAKTNETLSFFLKNGETQKEFEFILKGYIFKIRLDFFIEYEIFNTGLDTKTTSAKTQNAFLKACQDFGYYTQGYIYSQGANLFDYIILGTSKKIACNFEVKMSNENFAEGEKELDRLLENLAYYDIADYFRA
jgi:hypothetical protein